MPIYKARKNMAETVTLQIPEALYQSLAIPYCTTPQQPQT